MSRATGARSEEKKAQEKHRRKWRGRREVIVVRDVNRERREASLAANCESFSLASVVRNTARENKAVVRLARLIPYLRARRKIFLAEHAHGCISIFFVVFSGADVRKWFQLLV